MRYLYSSIFYLILPFIFLRLLWKARKNPAYLNNLHERLGIIKKPIAKNGIWIHAVSMGEAIASVPLIKILKQRYPDLPIIVTNETPTGAERIQTLAGDLVTQVYVPYDVPFAIKKFLHTVQPKLLVLMETEMWPNMLHYCKQRHIPVLLANARLSERSTAGYKRLGRFTQNLVQCLTLVAAQTQTDADHFVVLGLPADRIQVTGSIKFDLEIPIDLFEKAKILREQWGNNRLIWIAASTHEGEEELILKTFAAAKKTIPQLLLVSVPRHPERFKPVAEIYRRQNYHVVLRSENKACAQETDIFVGDTTGELLLFYAASDIVFIGGSLVEKGGQNPLEPAAIGLPILTGSHTFNFKLITQQLKNIGAEIQVATADELTSHIIELLRNEKKRREMGEKAKQFVLQNRGALDKQLALIEKFL